MNGCQGIDGLDFHYDFAFYKQIESISRIKHDAFVRDRQYHLGPRFNPAGLQLMEQAVLIGRLEQPRPQNPMDLQTGIDHHPRNRVDGSAIGFVSFEGLVVNSLLRQPVPL